ncbi:hypothetical protein SUDANB43_07365 [Streptomyces sp. enrichment culture]
MLHGIVTVGSRAHEKGEPVLDGLRLQRQRIVPPGKRGTCRLFVLPANCPIARMSLATPSFFIAPLARLSNDTLLGSVLLIGSPPA